MHGATFGGIIPRMTSIDPLRDALRAYMAQADISERELSLRAGINEKAVNQILTGKSQHPRSDTVAALAQTMGVPVADLISSPTLPAGVTRGVLPAASRERATRHARLDIMVPELAVTPQAGGGSEMPEMDGSGHHPVVGHWTMPADYLRSYVSQPQDVRVLRVAGDSMEPEYPAGERVMVDTSHRVPSPPGVYVLWDGFGLVLKRLELIMGTTAPPRLRISSVNAAAYPAYERGLDEVVINGRVIGKWQWR